MDVKSSRYTLEIYSFDNCISIKLKKANPRRQKKTLVEQLVCSWAARGATGAARQLAPPETLGVHTPHRTVFVKRAECPLRLLGVLFPQNKGFSDLTALRVYV